MPKGGRRVLSAYLGIVRTASRKTVLQSGAYRHGSLSRIVTARKPASLLQILDIKPSPRRKARACKVKPAPKYHLEFPDLQRIKKMIDYEVRDDRLDVWAIFT